MRILYIVQLYSGLSGFESTRAYDFSGRLAEAGHEVDVLCANSHRTDNTDDEIVAERGINLFRFPIGYDQKMSTLGRLRSFFLFMRWAIRKGKDLPRPDVIFSSSPPMTNGEIGRRVAKYHRVPFVFEVQDLWPEIPIVMGKLRNPVLRSMARTMARRIYRESAMVVAVTPDMEDGIRKWGIASEKLTMIPRGCDYGFFDRNTTKDRERKERGWNRKFVCIHPGAMGKVNGLDYMLEVGKILDTRNIMDVIIVLMGDGSEKQRLKQRVHQERIRCVQFRDFVPKYKMPEVLAAADIGIVTVSPIPLLASNSANKYFEYLSAGLPVLINYQGWQAKALAEYNAGFSSDPREPKTMADHILLLKNNREVHQELGCNARKLAKKKYDSKELEGRLEQVLLDVFSKGKTGYRNAC